MTERIFVGLIGLVFFVAFIVLAESLGLPVEFYVNWMGDNFKILILLFSAFLILIIGLLGAHLNYRYNRWLKNLSPEERRIEKENCEMADEIIKYVHKKYGDDHNLELVNVVNKKNEYSMIYKKSKNPQKIKISFNRKSKTIEESHAN